MSGVGQGPATASHAMGNLAAAAEVKGRELVHQLKLLLPGGVQGLHMSFHSNLISPN